jgi:hypothetical protein
MTLKRFLSNQIVCLFIQIVFFFETLRLQSSELLNKKKPDIYRNCDLIYDVDRQQQSASLSFSGILSIANRIGSDFIQ